MTRNVSRTVVVRVPLERAYEIWSSFEAFPRFLRTVEEVRVDGDRMHWRTRSAEFDATLTELTPLQRVSWVRHDGSRQHAVVSLRELAPGQTQVIFGAEYQHPPGAPDDRPAVFERALANFKAYAEGAAA